MSDHLTNIKSFGLEVALGLQTPDAYSQLPTETIALAKGVERLDIKPYTEAEAKTVLDYYHMAQVVYEGTLTLHSTHVPPISLTYTFYSRTIRGVAEEENDHQ